MPLAAGGCARRESCFPRTTAGVSRRDTRIPHHGCVVISRTPPPFGVLMSGGDGSWKLRRNSCRPHGAFLAVCFVLSATSRPLRETMPGRNDPCGKSALLSKLRSARATELPSRIRQSTGQRHCLTRSRTLWRSRGPFLHQPLGSALGDCSRLSF